MTKAERAEMYMAFLHEEGYAPHLDDDGDVLFKLEGGTYLIFIDADDEAYFQMLFPNFFEIDESQRDAVVRAALDATANTKVAKVFPVQQAVWASVEAYHVPPEGFKAVFERSVRSLQAAAVAFRERILSSGGPIQ